MINKLERVIPDVFVIGAMKAGTTTLFRNILVHSQIERTRVKEVGIFAENVDINQMAELYEHQFSKNDLVKCDVSPVYAKRHQFPLVAENIFKAKPDAKIIYITRDPIERILSHLHHNLLRDRFRAVDINKEVFENSDYVLTSKYWFQISVYLDLFPRDQLLILTLEELKLNPIQFCNKISSFLKIDPIKYESKMYYVSEARYQIKFYDPVHDLISNSLALKFYHYLWYFVNLKPKKPVVSSSVRHQLGDVLKDDCIKFVDTFNLDISNWQNFSS